MQSTFNDGMQVTRAVGTVLAYSIVVIAWMVMGRYGYLNHEICQSNGALRISPTPISYLVGGLCVGAGVYSALEALRLKRKGQLSHPAAHCIFIALGLMLIYDRATTNAELGPVRATINNGAFTTTFEFHREELVRVRQAERSASGPSMPMLELKDGRSIQLNWDPLPRAALTNFVSREWGVETLGAKDRAPHLNCVHELPRE